MMIGLRGNVCYTSLIYPFEIITCIYWDIPVSAIDSVLPCPPITNILHTNIWPNGVLNCVYRQQAVIKAPSEIALFVLIAMEMVMTIFERLNFFIRLLSTSFLYDMIIISFICISKRDFCHLQHWISSIF